MSGDKVRLLIIENADQDRFGIDTVLMVVDPAYDSDDALESSGLERPVIVNSIDISGHAMIPLINLGEYRAFMG